MPVKSALSCVAPLAAALSLAAALALAAPAAALEPLGQIGTSGSGAGELDGPRGVATDDADNLYVADRHNERVSQFTTQGAFVRAFGFDVNPGGGTGFERCTADTGCKGGAFGGGAGQLALPSGVGTDEAGNLYVADLSNNRVSQFTTRGAFVRAFGFDVVPGPPTGFEVCTAGTGCKVGNAGGGAGQLDLLDGVANDEAGNLYVADTGNARVSQFTTQGDFVRAFGFDVDPGGGTGFEVCTADTGCKVGTVGSGAGQLLTAFGIATDGAGTLYVTDGVNSRVSQYTTQGTFVRAFGFDVDPGAGTGFEVCTAATGCKAGTSGGAVGQFFSPYGVATDCRGVVYVGEATGDRVQRFGEAGTPQPPCHSGGTQPPPTGGPPPSGADPSTEFGFGKVKKNKRRGTAKLTVEVPGPGGLELAKTRKVEGDDERAEAQGSVKLVVKSKGKAKRKLAEKGKVRVIAEVTYVPDGGDPNTKTKRLKLVMR